MTLDELQALAQRPFFQLLQEARNVHEAHWPEREVQLCTLLSIKTGGCSEDCSTAPKVLATARAWMPNVCFPGKR